MLKKLGFKKTLEKEYLQNIDMVHGGKLFGQFKKDVLEGKQAYIKARELGKTKDQALEETKRYWKKGFTKQAKTSLIKDIKLLFKKTPKPKKKSSPYGNVRPSDVPTTKGRSSRRRSRRSRTGFGPVY